MSVGTCSVPKAPRAIKPGPLIDAAERVLNGLLDRLPRWRPLEDGYPELDKHLRVDMQ